MQHDVRDRVPYRYDIDLLRAFAVVAVVLYHISTRLLPGGFVGVDIFFVISGYLITGQLEQALQQNRFSFLDFYTRRFRRLYPALILVLVVTTLCAVFILTPGAQNQFGRELRAVATISVNYYFLGQENDYFGLRADQRPLLHMWSLSVEEQFYLIWPVLLWTLQRLLHGRNERLRLASDLMLILMLVISLYWCLFSSIHMSTQAFYGMPSRAWEFAAGGILALSRLATRDQEIIGRVLSGLGLLILLLAVFFINGNMVFPGYVALLPVIGALLFLAGGSLNRQTTKAMLGGLFIRALRHIGRISYSFYLWHWVLLALARNWYLERLLWRDALLGGVLSGILAHLTYIFVEQPVRQGRTPWYWLNHMRFRHGFYAILALYVLGNGIMFHPLVLTQAQQFVDRWANDPVLMPSGCRHIPQAGVPLAPIDSCSFGSPKNSVRILVWGDSHAGRLVPLLGAYSDLHHLRILLRSNPGCPPLIHTLPSGNGQDRPQCLAYANAVFSQLDQMQNLGVRGVLLDARWLLYEGSTVSGGVGLLPAPDRYFKTHDRYKALDRQHALDQMRLALGQELEQFRIRRMKVALMLPEAELLVPAAECLARFDSSYCNRPAADFLLQRQELVQMMQKLSSRYPDEVRLLDTHDYFCDHQWCYARSDGIVNFVDQDHISSSRMRKLAPYYAQVFDWLSQPNF